MWMLTLAVVFLAIHAGRMPIADSLLGISSPFVATAGDVLMTLVLATLLMSSLISMSASARPPSVRAPKSISAPLD